MPEFELSGWEWMVVLLICWGVLGLGFLAGWMVRDRLLHPHDDQQPAQRPQEDQADESRYTHPRGAHHADTTSFPAVRDAPAHRPSTGGRRRAPGPALTREQRRQLLETGQYDEGPASRS